MRYLICFSLFLFLSSSVEVRSESASSFDNECPVVYEDACDKIEALSEWFLSCASSSLQLLTKIVELELVIESKNMRIRKLRRKLNRLSQGKV